MGTKSRTLTRLINTVHNAVNNADKSPSISKVECDAIIKAFFDGLYQMKDEYRHTIAIAKLYVNIVVVFDHGDINITMASDIKASVYKEQIASSALFDNMVANIPKGVNLSLFALEDVFGVIKKYAALNILCNPISSLFFSSKYDYIIRPFMYGGHFSRWRNE